ncbi:conserved hypothetical protein [Catenulispora acidiphila DSM 44928]|uniref:Uncharacterized protein n=1 Tax=Catenulispora acidiphila (strain DSM 44928 / JCM 14897 / NBRC 102108 / NRRL B-24433 / ID139908) TaxID=479433 RepID=C7Q3H3_CATAD|nr:hypothetical protein [Catenulispora acidiphila]ACU75738.1 conserved hypothetical protein [Catenulispora acidiphila DSM 44928]
MLTDAPSSPTHHPLLLPLANGHVAIDPITTAPMQFFDQDSPDRQYLLDERQIWHSLEHQWGSGHVLSDRGTHRWNAPQSVTITPTELHALHELVDGLELTVTRTTENSLIETYAFRNTGSEAVTITGIGIQTPFADVYASAAESLRTAVHAHVFTGGSWAWAFAQPMDGVGRVLGLVVREGSLSSYSIESRNQYTLSNIRGHIVLQPTDFARNSTAFGGQPTITLPAGGEYVLRWEVGFHDSVDAFLATTRPAAELSTVSAPVGTDIVIRNATDQVTSPHANVEVIEDGHGSRVTSREPGVFALHIGQARTEVSFHRPVEHVVKARARYILAHQRTPERPGSLQFGLVPVDTRVKLTQATNGWSDWTDGSERIGMAILLQQARRRGWVEESVDELLSGWALMAESFLLDSSAAPRRGSQDQATPARLYDSPWLAQFFIDRYNDNGDPHHLDLAARVIERAFALGGDRFLAIGFSEACIDVITALEADGQLQRSQSMSDAVVESARHFAEAGHALPNHEVNYEQSIVAPLINLLIDAYRLSNDASMLTAIQQRLPWLLSFGGPQPHARLKDIAIRHWDGYWFGIERLWGDIFPHHWSALTSTVLYRLPAPLRSAHTDAIALTILRANMANYFDDGSATCAFIMPSTVDGRAAHLADPLANDQDWHLSLWLRMAERYGAILD